MVTDLLQGLRAIAAVVYSTTLGFLVFGLFWQTFNGWLPSGAVIALGAVLAIRVATLFGSMTAAATLNWTSIWIGGGVGLVTLVACWPSGADLGMDRPPRILMVPLLLASLVAVATAGALPSPKTAHYRQHQLTIAQTGLSRSAARGLWPGNGSPVLPALEPRPF